MSNSLQDQLLKAGLADARKSRKPRKGKKSPGAKKGEPTPEAGEAAQAARRRAEDKAARDRELNARRRAEEERRAGAAQAQQLVDQSRVSREGAEEAYHFVDGGVVRSLLVTPALRRQLAEGRLEIVRDGAGHGLVPAEAAERIRARDPERVIPRPPGEAEPDPDDPYADYPVPDDLMW